MKKNLHGAAALKDTQPKTGQLAQRSFGEFDAEAAARLITASADVALVLDGDGIIQDLSFGSDALSSEGYGKWLGQPWAETVTTESRIKVEELLRDAASKAPPRWRHVNHPSSQGADVPVLYSAVQSGPAGRVIAVGRDLRAVSALQQRLVDAQRSLERDYWRIRHVETRYRLLFQMASEAVLIIDSENRKVIEANPSASRLLGESTKRLVGRVFPDGFDPAGTKAVQNMLAGIEATGRADDVSARLNADQRELTVSASLFNHEDRSLFLIRMTPARTDADLSGSVASAQLLKVLERAPDAFVVTDFDGRIMTANAAFMELVQATANEQVRGESMERWLGRSGVDLNVLIANLRQHGTVRLFATTLRGEFGAVAEVEISAVSVPTGDEACLGFMIRNVGPRITGYAHPSPQKGPRSLEEVAELVGRVSLKELVQETTDLIERQCIESALKLTGDNRASAAEMLGLSRQSLYVKLRRFGLGESEPELDS